MLKRVRSHTCHHRKPTRVLLGNGKDLNLLLIRQTRCLTCRSERHKEIYASGHLPVNERSKCIVIHLTILERGNQGSSATFEFIFCHNY